MSNIITSFQIEGITCGSCKKIIQKRLSKIKNVFEVMVDEATGITQVAASTSVNLAEIKNALEGTPYRVV